MSRHVGFESWLERDHLMLLDFDSTVVGIASQPFRLHWRDEAGKAVTHVPDYLARRADGSVTVVDCRPVERRPPRDVAKFDATERACGLVGWSYRLVGRVDAIEAGNVRWLTGYRHPRYRTAATVAVFGRCSTRRPRWWRARRRSGTRSPCCRCCSTCCGHTSWSRICRFR
jgi:hypothetical protein